MSDHVLVATFDRDVVRLRTVCKAAPDALCRNNPDCGCESYGGVEKDEQGWFHVAYNPDFDFKGPHDDTNPEEVKHRHNATSYCNYREWMDNGEMEECGPVGEVELGRIPIDFDWQGDYYTWKPVVTEQVSQ